MEQNNNLAKESDNIQDQRSSSILTGDNNEGIDDQDITEQTDKSIDQRRPQFRYNENYRSRLRVTY